MAPLSIPVGSKVRGFTNKMYAIVMNVVKPAITSVLTFVPFLERPNNLSAKLSVDDPLEIGISSFNYKCIYIVTFNPLTNPFDKTKKPPSGEK